MTRQPKEWEKAFANEANYKGLLSIVYKELTQPSVKKNLNQKI